MNSSASEKIYQQVAEHLEAGDYKRAYELTLLIEDERDCSAVSLNMRIARIKAALNLGNSGYLDTSFNEAEKWMGRGNWRDPDHVKHLTEIGTLMQAAGRDEQATSLYLKAIERITLEDGKLEHILLLMLHLTDAYARSRQFTLSWHVLDRAELASRRLRWHPLRGLCCFLMAQRDYEIFGDVERAQARISEAIALSEGGDPYQIHHTCHLLKAKIILDQNNAFAAFRHAGKASWGAQVLGDMPGHALALAIQARCYHQQGQIAKAEYFFDQASDLEREHPGILLHFIDYLYATDRYDEAIRIAQRLLSGDTHVDYYLQQMVLNYWLARSYRSLQQSELTKHHSLAAKRCAEAFLENLDEPYRGRMARGNTYYRHILELREKI